MECTKSNCSICIYGDVIDFDEISKKLSLTPTKIIEKNQVIVGERIADKSIWSYKISANEGEDLEIILRQLVEIVYLKKNVILQISEEYEIRINCYVRSEFGQIGFSISPDIMSILSEINVEIDFHILSYGMVE